MEWSSTQGMNSVRLSTKDARFATNKEIQAKVKAFGELAGCDFTAYIYGRFWDKNGVKVYAEDCALEIEGFGRKYMRVTSMSTEKTYEIEEPSEVAEYFILILTVDGYKD